MKHTWHSFTQEKILSVLSSKISGLDRSEVEKRQEQYGPNQLPSKKKLSSFIIFLSQFRSPLIYILVIAAVVSFILGEQVDAGVIIAAVIVNTIVGFFQERKAQNALLELRQAVVVTARVKRQGTEEEITATQLVPGDIVILEAGDRVPADCRLLSAKNVRVNEAPLTGESWEIEKNNRSLSEETELADRSNMLYMGTTLTSGKAQAVVVATGLQTEIGRIASLLSQVEDENTPLQVRMAKLSKQIGFFVLGVVVFIVVFGLYLDHSFVEMFEIGVAVAVSAIPEGMVVALTVVLALGMQRILKKKGLVRKLVAAEALGSTTVICTDKTGTLTTGEMQVAEIAMPDFYFNTLDNISLDQAKEGLSDILRALTIGVLCNEAAVEHESESLKDVKIFGNMTERALLLAGMNFGLHKHSLLSEQPEVDLLPFDSAKKFMATLHKENDKLVLYAKGAPEKILERCGYYYSHDKAHPLNDKKKKEFEDLYEKMTQSGLRVLGLAKKGGLKEIKTLTEEEVNDLVFYGFVGIKDPIRPKAKETIDTCRQAGLKVVMITGDHQLTAKAIAKEIGLSVKKENIITGQELKELSDKSFNKIAPNIQVYARVTPADKLRIIRAWQHQGEVVAMTGDGVNDAPALKSADIGVAMGGGTEVAKGASDLVILDGHFSTIVAAIEQGRVIYDNIKKVILYLMSDSLAEVLIIVFALIAGWPLPLLATQILWVNIVDDGLPGMALTTDPEDPAVMKEKPKNISQSILDGQNKLLILLISLTTAITTLGIFYYFWQTSNDINLARTAAFTGLALSTLMYVFSCRSLRHDFFHSIRVKNWYLLGAVGIGLIMQLIAVYVPFFQKIFQTVPLGFGPWLAIFAQGIFIIAVVELIKGLYIIRMKKTK